MAVSPRVPGCREVVLEGVAGVAEGKDGALDTSARDQMAQGVKGNKARMWRDRVFGSGTLAAYADLF